MNKTQNYQLSLWDKNDRLLMADFNEDNGKIDAALASLQTQVNTRATTSTATSLQNQINAKTAIVTGTYTGNGGSQTINLGFAPKAVFFVGRGGTTNISSIYLCYGIILPGYPMYANQNSASKPAAAIQGNGFVVSSAEQNHAANEQGMVYHYVAFR